MTIEKISGWLLKILNLFRKRLSRDVNRICSRRSSNTRFESFSLFGNCILSKGNRICHFLKNWIQLNFYVEFVRWHFINCESKKRGIVPLLHGSHCFSIVWRFSRWTLSHRCRHFGARKWGLWHDWFRTKRSSTRIGPSPWGLIQTLKE